MWRRISLKICRKELAAMLKLKSDIADSHIFQLTSTVIVVGLIVIAEIVLIGENAAFLKAQGKSSSTALALATCVALLIPVVPGLLVEDRRWWVQAGKWLFVTCLITMQVYFASQTAIAPQLQRLASASETALISDYKDQLKKYDDQIAVYQKHIDSFPDSFRSKRAELSGYQLKLIEDRRKVLTDLRTISRKTTAESKDLTGLFQHLTILVTILYRLALEIGVVILTCSLRIQFSRPLSEPAQAPVQLKEPTKMQSPVKSNDGQRTIAPKSFVLSIYPQAYCKSKSGIKGPYVIYSNRRSNTEIAKASNPAKAWHTASQKLRKGTVLQQQDKKRPTSAPKVYAIKS